QIYTKMADGSMLGHLSVTLFETIIGFLLGTILGIILASVLWSSKRVANISDPYLVILNAMPKVALGPIIIVALGPGYISIIMMGPILSVIMTTLTENSASNDVDPKCQTVLRTFGATRWQCFKEDILASTLPTMISTLKVDVDLRWVGDIVAEFLVSK